MSNDQTIRRIGQRLRQDTEPVTEEALSNRMRDLLWELDRAEATRQRAEEQRRTDLGVEKKRLDRANTSKDGWWDLGGEPEGAR
jgi:hypothetical protein